jgi:hypothetical protein
MNKIEKFIALFNNDEKFTNGLCYWFAYILKGRFPNGEIWYDQIENHFYFVVNNKTFDVSGEVTLPNTAIKWNEYSDYDELDYQRVIKYCVLKEGD